MISPELDGRLRIAGERVAGVDRVSLIDPYRAEPIASIEMAGPDQVAAAIADADANGRQAMASMPLHRRVAAARSAAAQILEEIDSLAILTSRQTGKALRDARGEVERSVRTLGATASAAEQMDGTILRADAMPSGEGMLALVTANPIGVVAAISPFNSPVNLPMHKLAPALVMGNAVVFKPAPQAPLSGHRIVEILVQAGFPASAIQVVTGGADVGAAMVRDARVGAVSFTGGTVAGTAIAHAAGLKRLLLELGGNSPNVVHADADLDHAAKALVTGAFSNTGQSCNSVQRILVHRSITDPLTRLLRARAADLRVGDPLDPDTDVGTLIDEDAAVRVERWIHAAVSEGATLVIGGARSGAQLEPTILADVRPDQEIACQEVFGPVAVIIEYESLAEAIELANATEYGLQAAVFTRSLGVAYTLASGIRAGGVMINRSSNFRLDHAPFGGIRASGLGREGGAWGLREYVVEKLILADLSAGPQAD